jgi:hypothetical protein
MAAINPGFDLFTVVEGSTYFNLEPLFPGAGIIYSEGIPIDPENFGNFSTGIERQGSIPDGQSGVIPIEMFAENSISKEPVKLFPFGLGEGVGEFHTIINRGGIFPHLINTDGLVRPSTGVMTVHRNRTGGGRFELTLNINPLIVITKVGGSIKDITSPDIIKIIDGSGLLNPVGSIGGQWTADDLPKISAKRNPAFPIGDFFIATDRFTKEPITVQLTSGGLDAQRLVQIAF